MTQSPLHFVALGHHDRGIIFAAFVAAVMLFENAKKRVLALIVDMGILFRDKNRTSRLFNLQPLTAGSEKEAPNLKFLTWQEPDISMSHLRHKMSTTSIVFPSVHNV